MESCQREDAWLLEVHTLDQQDFVVKMAKVKSFYLSWMTRKDTNMPSNVPIHTVKTFLTNMILIKSSALFVWALLSGTGGAERTSGLVGRTHRPRTWRYLENNYNQGQLLSGGRDGWPKEKLNVKRSIERGRWLYYFDLFLYFFLHFTEIYLAVKV